MDRNGSWPHTGVMTTAIEPQKQLGYTVVSRHHTSQGEVTYVRCTSCQALRMLHQPGFGADALSAGNHADRCPNCDG